MVEFLKRLWRRFIDSFRGPAEDAAVVTRSVSESIDEEASEDVRDEVLARFVPERGHKGRIGVQRREAKPSAFLPMFNEQSSRFETSTFRVAGLDEDAIWMLGDMHVASTQGPLVASAMIGEHDVRSAGLAIDADDTPPRHANIVGWPEEKDARKELAMLLRDASWLLIRR